MKLLLTLAIIGALAFCGATVPLGSKTFFGHVKAIWASKEVGELKEGVKDKAEPAMKKGEKFVEGGIHAIEKDGSGSGSAAAPAKR